MNGFVYIVTEGVQDVAFLGKTLATYHGAVRIRSHSDLDVSSKAWLASFRWPVGDRIDRLAVPAPVFYRTAAGKTVALRNAQGITEIENTLMLDLEAFERHEMTISTIGIVLDSDDEPAERRMSMVGLALGRLKLDAPAGYGQVTTGSPRVGVFALPEPGKGNPGGCALGTG